MSMLEIDLGNSKDILAAVTRRISFQSIAVDTFVRGFSSAAIKRDKWTANVSPGSFGRFETALVVRAVTERPIPRGPTPAQGDGLFPAQIKCVAVRVLHIDRPADQQRSVVSNLNLNVRHDRCLPMIEFGTDVVLTTRGMCVTPYIPCRPVSQYDNNWRKRQTQLIAANVAVKKTGRATRPMRYLAGRILYNTVLHDLTTY